MNQTNYPQDSPNHRQSTEIARHNDGATADEQADQSDREWLEDTEQARALLAAINALLTNVATRYALADWRPVLEEVHAILEEFREPTGTIQGSVRRLEMTE